MVIAFSLIQILAVGFVHDLSEEYDMEESFLLKEKQKKAKTEKADVCELKKENLKTKENNLKRWIANTLKGLFSNYNLALVYHLFWLFYYCFAFVTVCLPVIVLNKLRYEVEISNSYLVNFAVNKYFYHSWFYSKSDLKQHVILVSFNFCYLFPWVYVSE